MALFCDDVSAIVRCACAATPWLSSGPCDCATATDEPAKERTAGAARTPTIRIGNAARPCMHDSPIASVANPSANARRRLLVHTINANGRAQPYCVRIAPFACSYAAGNSAPVCKTRHWRLTCGPSLQENRGKPMNPINSGFLSSKPAPEGSGIMYYSTLFRPLGTPDCDLRTKGVNAFVASS